MNGWAACIQAADCEALAALRLLPGVECAAFGGIIWLRGHNFSEELDKTLAKVPGLERFELLPSGRLKSPGCRVPHRLLPTLAWSPLKTTLVPAMPNSSLPGEVKQKLTLNIVRSDHAREASALLVSMNDWAEFALNAPLVRLKPIAFAAAEDGRVLLLGQPLPSLPGLRLVNLNGILIPCGHAWSPAVNAAVLREVFALASNDMVMLMPDGTQQIVSGEQFVPASRAAVRATKEAA